jgi:hypothetical protein
MRPRLLVGVLLLALACAAASAQSTTPGPCAAVAGETASISPCPELPEITSGQHVKINGNKLPAQDIKIRLWTGRPEDKPLYRDATVQDAKVLTFLADIPIGNYLVSVIIAGKEPGTQVPGHLRVVADSDGPVKLTAIHPLTQYPNAKHGDYDLVLVGENFARNPEDNKIVVVGRGPETPIHREDYSVACESDANFTGQTGEKRNPCLEVPKGLETQELKLVGFHPDKYSGPVKIQVQVPKNNISQPVTVTLSRVSSALLLVVAMAVFIVLAWFVVLLVSKDVKVYRIGDQSYGPFTAFFLDKETNSFSLSKFQLLSWTAVSVFGYVYLFVCRLLVQWDFSFPPIPDNLPQLLAISAGTTVAATGITRSVGSKGAGSVQPSFADFISAGGLVVGERFQFFVWTLVGCFVFISLLLMADPSTLKDLPKVPDGFLYLMGISSAGYLAGKVVRKPGPVLKLLAVTKVASADGDMPSNAPSAADAPRTFPVLIIELQGENLGTDAMLQIDGHPLDRKGDFWVKGTPDPQTHFCTQVLVGINDALAKCYTDGQHTLTFVNNDGQASSATFPVDALKIESIETVTTGAAAPNNRALKVTGKNFAKPGMRFEWRTPATAQQTTANGDILAAQVTSATELTIPLVAGMQGAGKLTLISAMGLRASLEYTIA